MATNVNSLKNAIKSVSYNMLLQICLRILTFISNIILLRYISKEILGLINVRLLLLYTTIQFLSREAVRKACLTTQEDDLRHERPNKFRITRIINLVWVCVLTGIVSSLILSILWMFLLEQPSTRFVFQYKIAVISVGLSSVCELFVEPIWIFTQKYDFILLKAIMEGVYLILRSVLAMLLIIKFPDHSLYAFGFAFIFATFCYLAIYYAYMFWFINNKNEDSSLFPVDSIMEFFPSFKLPEPYFEPYYKSLTVSFYKQSLLKQFLTEGEKYVMTLFSVLSLEQQGVYDVINNLGSLAARFIFMPIEESYYIYLSKLLTRGKHIKMESEDVSYTIHHSLSISLKFVSLVGLLILTFGVSYSELLLDIYGGKILTSNEGPLLLKTYCLYVFVLAINGITECFMFASMTKALVDSYNQRMLLFSGVFLLASLLLTRYFGSVGFILANVLNMLLRIRQSVSFIRDQFQGTSFNPLASIVPSNGVKVALSVSFIITKLSEYYLCCNTELIFKLLHVFIGGICFLLAIGTIYLTESEFVAFVKNFIHKRKTNNE